MGRKLGQVHRIHVEDHVREAACEYAQEWGCGLFALYRLTTIDPCNASMLGHRAKHGVLVLPNTATGSRIFGRKTRPAAAYA